MRISLRFKTTAGDFRFDLVVDTPLLSHLTVALKKMFRQYLGI